MVQPWVFVFRLTYRGDSVEDTPVVTPTLQARMDPTFEYVFPSIRGVQAGREFYVSMCPLHLIPKIFLFNEEEVTPELRAQRVLNKARLPQLARYILDNPKTYIFSALTASIDGDVKFDAIGTK